MLDYCFTLDVLIKASQHPQGCTNDPENVLIQDSKH